MARSLRPASRIVVSAWTVTALALAGAPSAYAEVCPTDPPPTQHITTTTTLNLSSESVVFPGTLSATAAVSGGAGQHGSLSISVDDHEVDAATPSAQPLQTTIGPLDVGAHTVQAHYSGDEVEAGPPQCRYISLIIAGSQSRAAKFTVTPEHIATSITVDATAATDTQPVTVAAHVASDASTPDTGTVTFAAAGRQQVADVDSAGRASTTFDPLPAGSHSMSVSYSGGDSGNVSFDPSHTDVSLATGETPSIPLTPAPPPAVAADPASTPLTVPVLSEPSAPSPAPGSGSGASSGTPNGTVEAARGPGPRGRRKGLRIRVDDYWAWTAVPNATRMVKLRITSVPAASTVRVTCHGSRCPQRLWKRRNVARLDLGRQFRTASLAPGTKLEVKIERHGFVGFWITYRVRARQGPKASWGCLSATTSRPTSCSKRRRRG